MDTNEQKTKHTNKPILWAVSVRKKISGLNKFGQNDVKACEIQHTICRYLYYLSDCTN